MIGGTSADEIDALIGAMSAPRALLEGLARRFRPADPDAQVDEVGAFLATGAGVWERCRGRLAKLAAAEPRVAEAGPAAEAAVAAGDLDAADSALAAAEVWLSEPLSLAEARRRARLRQVRADLMLLKGDAESAAAHLEAAAGFLLPLAPLEAASVRDAGAGQPRRRGAADRGAGLPLAIELGRRNEAILTRTSHPEDMGGPAEQARPRACRPGRAGRRPGGTARRGGGGLPGGAGGPGARGRPGGLGQDAGQSRQGAGRPGHMVRRGGRRGASRRGGDSRIARRSRRLREHRLRWGGR